MSEFNSTLANDAADLGARARDLTSDLASRAGESASKLGEQAKGALDTASSYFRERDMTEIASDVRSYMKAHPTQALIGAAVVGFLVAGLVRRR